MKKIVFLLGFLVISISAMAQDKDNVQQSDLKGPAYKNFKSWMHKAVPTKIYSEKNKVTLQGPTYKNQHPAKSIPQQNLVLVQTTGSERQKLTGPEFKNHGPWNNTSKQELVAVETVGTEK